MAMKDFWNARYSEDEYVYGVAPNQFFADQIEKFSKGKVLLPAEGQGRNAVFAANLGWEVFAFDFSPKAREKALVLAEAEKVEIHYDLMDYDNLHLPEGEYDLAALIYAHMSPEQRPRVHREVVKALKPGGRLILEGFHKNQLGKDSGGPKSLDMLFNEKELEEDFAGMEIIILEAKEVELDEGPYHRGIASVIRLVARKPEED